jgi:hypothetical protein
MLSCIFSLPAAVTAAANSQSAINWTAIMKRENKPELDTETVMLSGKVTASNSGFFDSHEKRKQN